MYTPNQNEPVQRVVKIRDNRGLDVETDDLQRWEDEGGQNANRTNEAGGRIHIARGNRSNLSRAEKMAMYKVGDTVVHWTYGSGKIVAIDDKGSPGKPCFYYVIEGSDQMLWIPVDEGENSSLHLPTLRTEFGQFISILRSEGKRLSNNPHHRRKELAQHMQKRSLAGACRLIRDLTYHSRWRKLSSSDTRILKHAQSLLLDEWERSLGTPRAQARGEMEWILKETPARKIT